MIRVERIRMSIPRCSNETSGLPDGSVFMVWPSRPGGAMVARRCTETRLHAGGSARRTRPIITYRSAGAGASRRELPRPRPDQVVHRARRDSARPRHLHGLLQLPAHPPGLPRRRQNRPRRSTISSPSSGSCRPSQPPTRRYRWPADRPSSRGPGVAEILGLYSSNLSSHQPQRLWSSGYLLPTRNVGLGSWLCSLSGALFPARCLAWGYSHVIKSQEDRRLAHRTTICTLSAGILDS
jgi:hypothetical protein